MLTSITLGKYEEWKTSPMLLLRQVSSALSGKSPPSEIESVCSDWGGQPPQRTNGAAGPWTDGGRGSRKSINWNTVERIPGLLIHSFKSHHSHSMFCLCTSGLLGSTKHLPRVTQRWVYTYSVIARSPPNRHSPPLTLHIRFALW